MNRIKGVPLQVLLLIFFFFVLILLLYPDSNIDVVYKPLKETSSVPATLLVVGDIMLDRTVATRIKQFGLDYPFEGYPELFSGNDVSVANLEGVFSSNESVATPLSGVLRFTFNPTLAPVLKKWNIDVVSQANNHTADFGLESAIESRNILARNSISVFGDFYNELDLVAERDIRGEKIVFIAYNDFAKGLDRVLSLISSSKSESNLVIVMPHWGDEYVATSSERQQRIGREFIDAGADMVIGTHPHVVQEISVYKGKPIFYSLGNLVFDQDFSRDTTEGLGLKISVLGNEITFRLKPYTIVKSQVRPMGEDRQREFLKELSYKSYKSFEEFINEGVIRISLEP